MEKGLLVSMVKACRDSLSLVEFWARGLRYGAKEPCSVLMTKGDASPGEIGTVALANAVTEIEAGKA